MTLDDLCTRLLPPDDHWHFATLIMEDHHITLVAAMPAPRRGCVTAKHRPDWPLGAQLVPGSWPGSACQAVAALCSGGCEVFLRQPIRRRTSWASTIGPGAKAPATARSWSIESAAAPLTCWRTAWRIRWRPGSRRIPRSPSWPVIGRNRMQPAFGGGHQMRCRWPTASISCRTSRTRWSTC